MITRRDWLRRTAIFTGATLPPCADGRRRRLPRSHAGHDMNGWKACPLPRHPHNTPRTTRGHHMGGMQGMAPKPSMAPPLASRPTRARSGGCAASWATPVTTRTALAPLGG